MNTDFIGHLHTGMLLCFHWNVLSTLLCFNRSVFNIHIQMLSGYTLI